MTKLSLSGKDETNTLQKTLSTGGDSTPCSMQSHHGEVEDDSPYFLLSFYGCCSSSTKAHFWLSLTGSCLLTATGVSPGFDTGNGKASRWCNPHPSHVCFYPHNPRACLSIADMMLSLSSSCETAWGAIPYPSTRWSREAQTCPTVGILGPHQMIQDRDGIRSFGVMHLLCVTQTDGFIRLLEPGLGLKVTPPVADKTEPVLSWALAPFPWVLCICSPVCFSPPRAAVELSITTWLCTSIGTLPFFWYMSHFVPDNSCTSRTLGLREPRSVLLWW